MLIKETNRAKIEQIIKDAEGRATARTIDYYDIAMAIWNLERKLDIPKVKMEGIETYVDVNAQDFPNAYKYTPTSTHFHAVRKKAGWDLVKVYRDPCQRPGRKYEVHLSDTAKEAILERHTMFA